MHTHDARTWTERLLAAIESCVSEIPSSSKSEPSTHAGIVRSALACDEMGEERPNPIRRYNTPQPHLERLHQTNIYHSENHHAKGEYGTKYQSAKGH